MTGWRLGYCGGPKEIISGMNKIQSQSTTSTSSISMAAAVEALNGDQEFIKKHNNCLLYTSPSPRDATLSRMPSSA